MSLFARIKLMLEEIDSCCPYIEYCEGEFTYDTCQYELQYYNDRGVYGGDIKEGTSEQDDCTFINYDNGCGETITKVFLTKNKLSEEDLYDKYAGCM